MQTLSSSSQPSAHPSLCTEGRTCDTCLGAGDFVSRGLEVCAENTMQDHATTLMFRVSYSSPFLSSPAKRAISPVCSLCCCIYLYFLLFCFVGFKIPFLIEKKAGEIRGALLKPPDSGREKE